MKAVVQNAYGSPDVLELRDVDVPAVGDDEVLIRVRAASIHAGDYFMLRGEPYLARFTAGWPKPKNYVPGYDVAGEIEAVGKNVSGLKPGDEVFGECGGGGCAEYVSAKAKHMVRKSAGLSFEQAAAVPTSGLAALQGLRDAGKVRPGQHVLINGASGGVGTFAVQIAKSMGAEVTGVCSTGSVDLVRSLGADHVVDYTREDFTEGGPRYDLIVDNVANRTFAECKRALKPTGIHLPNSGNAGIGYLIGAMVRSWFAPQQRRPFLSMPNAEDLAALKELVDSGKVVPIIDSTYSLAETPEALRRIGDRHAHGKVIIRA